MTGVTEMGFILESASPNEFAAYDAGVRDAFYGAIQICQHWIDDHSKADNCTYNDCDMVAAVTDVMNEIKGMRKLND